MVAYLLRRLQMIFDVIKKAKQLFYDNKNSGLDVNNVQDAIDELTQAIVEVDAINEASGSPILLTDTIDDSLLDFKAYGRSTQVQYSGKNLLKNTATTQTLNGLTFTVNEDKSVTVNGTATARTDIVLGVCTLKAGQSYKLSGCVDGGSISKYRLQYTDSTVASSYMNDYGTNGTIPQGQSDTYTPTEDMVDGKVRINIFEGTALTNATFYPMIRLASITDDTYEPYVGGVASPNPDYPQAIKSVADGGYFDGELLQGGYSAANGLISSRNDYISNKNMIPCKQGDNITVVYDGESSMAHIFFYDENKNYISYITTTTTNAPANACYFNFSIYNASGIALANAKPITVTINNKYALIVKSKGKNLLDVSNCIGVSGGEKFTLEGNTITIASGSNVYGVMFSNDYVGLKKGGTYSFSSKVISGTITNEYRLRYSNGTYSNNISTNTTVTIAKEVSYILFYLGRPYTGSTDVVISDLQIEENTEVTDYEPYKETVTYIPLNEPLRSNLDRTVTDEVSLTEVTRRFKEVVFDGSDDEGWNLLSINTNTNLFRIYPPTKAKCSPIICSHFVYYSGSNEDFEHTRLSAEATPVLAMWVNKTRIATVDEWKTWLQANPITVQYELAEPITEEIETNDIVTYDNVTHLTASDNADMWVEYYSNSSVGQRLAKVDNKVLELDTVKELYKTATVKARMNGKIIELTGTVCTENELNQCLAVLRNKGYDPDNVIALCMYNTGGDNIIGRLSIIGNYVVVSDINNENFISDYTLTFNVMYMIKE